MHEDVLMSTDGDPVFHYIGLVGLRFVELVEG